MSPYGLAEALGESISLLTGVVVGGVGVFRLNKLPGSLLCLDDHYGGGLQQPDPQWGPNFEYHAAIINRGDCSTPQ